MFKRKNVDATKGALIPLIIAYSVPLILSTIVQTLFNAVDMAVLGNMADPTSVASVGATSSVFSLLVHGFVGISAGLKILLANYIGAKDTKKVTGSISTALIFSFVFGVIIAFFGFVFTPPLLSLTNCPSDCFDGAVIYLRIYFLATPAVLIYNYGSSILTAGGDTQRPLYYMLAGGVLNLALNIILCIILPQKVVAVAIATAASQILGAILVLSRIKKVYDLHIKSISFDMHALVTMLKFGIPIAVTNVLYPIANLQMQSAINSYGSAAIAGNSASINFEGIVAAFTGAFATTSGVFMSQNLGALKHDRVKKSLFHSLWMSVTVSALVGGLLFLGGRFLMSLLLGGKSPEAVEYGMMRSMFVTLPYFITGINGILGHAMQAFGYPAISSVNSIICILGFRIAWMKWIYPMFHSLIGVMACFTVSWILLLLLNLITFTVIFCRYLKGKYKYI